MKKKKPFDMLRKSITSLFLLLSIFAMNAQQITVKGTVTDTKKEPLTGVTIIVKGTDNGATTDMDGRFQLNNVPANGNLEVSYVGMKSQTIPVNNRQVINVTLADDTELLDELVVTALGIKRSEKSLPYATQKISGSEITSVPTPNLLSSLAGKTAGMTVSGSGSGVGSSVKVVLRGNRSIQGNNQPLYIVDGTPINSGIFTQTGADGGYGGGIDAGGGMAGINADDIESINVLKGATAAALYGSQAANGVIVITTKRGQMDKTSISFTSSVQADIPYMTYKFQDRYAMGVNGENKTANDAWGAKKSNEDLSNTFVHDFFNTGTTFQNGIAISGGSKAIQNYLSYQNTTAKGIIPNNKFDKHNFSLRSTTALFDKFIEVDGSIALTKQNIDNAPSAPGQYFNPIVGLYLFPQGTTEFNKYKETYEIANPARNGLMKQNWPHERDVNKNPYWLINRYNYSHEMEKAIAKASVKFNFTDWLNLQFRGSYDKTNTVSERKVHAGIETIAGPGGRYDLYTVNNAQAYGDVLLSLSKQINDFSVNATLGSSINDSKIFSIDNTLGDLVIPNLFDLRNYTGVGRPINRKEHRQMQSVFGTASFGYADIVYLDLTGRNDWSSTLAAKNRSYFYPSVGTSFVFTELLNKNAQKINWLDFGKLRFSWTKVGNDMPWGLTNPQDQLSGSGTINANTVAPFTDLEPEKSTSWEGGINLRMFNNRVSFDAALYQTITENQYFLVDNTSGSGFSKYYINAGKVRNRGFEMTLGYTPIQTKDFTWNGYLNFSTNKNLIVSLPEQYDNKNGFELSNAGYKSRLYAGQEWGQMYGKRLKRDEQGRIIVTQVVENGTKKGYELSQGDDELIGNVNPKCMLGLKNEFTYKDFSFGFLIDGRFGGNVLSITQGFLDGAGRSAVTADARDNGGVQLEGVLKTITKVNGKKDVETFTDFNGKIDAQTYYKTAPGGEINVYDATNIRLREVNLSYNLPQSAVSKLKVVNSIRLSLIGRNLLFLYKKAPYDPENTLSTSGNGGANTDNFGLPATRNIGFSLNVNF